MIWSAPWTRRHIFRDIPEDILVHIDVPNANGWNRYWRAMIPFDDRVVEFPVLSQSILTTPTGSLQNTNGGVDATWNNSNNTIETVGAGASGGAVASSTAGNWATGGGAGAYSKILNFTIASPGTTTFNWQLGTGGTSVTTGSVSVSTVKNGTVGGDTWWNNTAFPATGGTDNTQCAAKGGGAGNGGTSGLGGTGGLNTSGWGQTRNSGGAGGGASGSNVAATGAGGAGGPTAGGNTGVATTTGTASNGGSADNGGTGAGGAGTGVTGTGNQTGGAGGNGTEFNASHGCGGGGGGGRTTSTASTGTGGAGGNYGGGGGGGANNTVSSSTGTSGAGIQGIAVLTWIPGTTTKHPNLLPLLGAGMIVSSQFNRRQLMKMLMLLRGIKL